FCLTVGRPLRPARRRIFKILLASVRCCVEKTVSVGQAFGTARISRVGMEHLAVEAKENTQTVLFAFPEVSLCLPCLQFRFASVIILRRSHLLIQRDVEVVIEIAIKRGVPGSVPTLERLVSLQLDQRRARD